MKIDWFNDMYSHYLHPAIKLKLKVGAEHLFREPRADLL